MILFFDTETTGLPKDWRAPISDLNNWPRLVQLSYEIYTEDGRFYKKENLIIKPNGYIIPEASSKIHMISTEKALKDGQEIEIVLNKLANDISFCDIVVAHNIEFDYSVIASECYRADINDIFEGKKQICTMKESTEYCKILGNYGYKWPSLAELHFTLFNQSFFDAHDASVDVNITAKCFWELIRVNIIRLNTNTVFLDEILESVATGQRNEELKNKTCKICGHIYEEILVYCNKCGNKMNLSKIDTFPHPDENYYEQIQINEVDVQVAKELGSDALAEGNYYEALEYFQKAAELAAGDSLFEKADCLNGIGICYFKLSNFKEAEKYFLKIIEILPSFPFTYENLVASYYNLNEFDKMFKICETLPENIEISSSIWFYVGKANEQLGDFEFARSAINKAINGGFDCFDDLERILKKINNL